MAKTFLDVQNIRASKIEASASKILDVDLARFYNQTISEMVKYGLKLKKVTTNIVAAQSEYTTAVLTGFVSSALVKINGYKAPYIDIDDYIYTLEKGDYAHTVIDDALSILPVPTVALTNGLEVWYWAKLPEIIDAAIAGTALTDVNDKDWAVIVQGITLKMYEKLLITSIVTLENLPDGNVSQIIKIVEYHQKKYNEELENYATQNKLFTRGRTSKGPTARDGEVAAGIGRQQK